MAGVQHAADFLLVDVDAPGQRQVADARSLDGQIQRRLGRHRRREWNAALSAPGRGGFGNLVPAPDPAGDGFFQAVGGLRDGFGFGLALRDGLPDVPEADGVPAGVRVGGVWAPSSPPTSSRPAPGSSTATR